MKNMRSSVIGVSYQMERLLQSKMIQETVEKKDKESFIKLCKKLSVPKKYWNALVEIVFSITPDQAWPWG